MDKNKIEKELDIINDVVDLILQDFGTTEERAKDLYENYIKPIYKSSEKIREELKKIEQKVVLVAYKGAHSINEYNKLLKEIKREARRRRAADALREDGED